MRVSRAERACVVCRVRYERVLEGLLWASSGITVCDPIVVVGAVTICDGMVHLRCIGQTSVMRRFAPVCGCSKRRDFRCLTPCVWDSVSNADGIAGGNESLPHARARVKQTTNLDSTEVHNTSCPCLLNNRALSGCGPGVVDRHCISCVPGCLWLVTVGNSVVMAGIGVVTR